MAFSTILKTSVLRGQTLKALTNQLVRSTSTCIELKSRPATPSVTLLKGNSLKPQLLASSYGSSQILSKYFASSPVLKSADKGHDHVGIWKLERVLSIALLPLIPAALISPSQGLDTVVALVIVMHTHWGLEAIVVDYIRPILFGEIGPKIGMGLLYLFSAVTLAGCLNLIYNDIGLANVFREIWKL